MPRWSIHSILIFFVIILVAFAWLTLQWQQDLYTPLLTTTNAPAVFEVKAGAPLNTTAWQLKRANLIKSPKKFILLARLRGDLGKIKAGEYLIQPGKTTAAQLLDNMINGRVFLRQITLVEGWTFQQIMNALNSSPYLQHKLTNLKPQEVMAQLGYPNINPEGRFYPDTYLFSKGTPDTVILKKSYQMMQNLLTQQWNNRAANLPYQTAEQALTAASLIERETAVPAERPLIAGVIARRLQQNMRLQIDPTVIYALGTAYQGKLTSQNMKINSPYNTYLYKGLPPSPIAVPSAASLNAALHPAAGDALYYVSKNDGSGQHIFSATLQQHDAAIKQYLLAPKIQLPTTPLIFPNK